MDGKRAANGQHDDEPDQKKPKPNAAGKPVFDRVGDSVISPSTILSAYVCR